MTRVHAVVVLYHPSDEYLIRLIKSIAAQVERVVLVANSQFTTSLGEYKELRTDIDVIQNDANIGLAAAQNIGTKLCIDSGADYVLYLDQDSFPPPDLVQGLVSAHEKLIAAGLAVAAVAPLLIDETTGAAWPFQSSGWFRTQESAEPDNNGVCKADYLFSSGSLISTQSLLKVGLYLESLFIDHVDLEWCFRAQHTGLLCYGIPSIQMKHNVGEGHVLLFGRRHPIHSAERDYYVFRNSACLMKSPHIPLRWKLNEFIRLLPRAVFYSLCHKNFIVHLLSCLRGLRDGITMAPPSTTAA